MRAHSRSNGCALAQSLGLGRILYAQTAITKKRLDYESCPYYHLALVSSQTLSVETADTHEHCSLAIPGCTRSNKRARRQGLCGLGSLELSDETMPCHEMNIEEAVSSQKERRKSESWLQCSGVNFLRRARWSPRVRLFLQAALLML